MWISLPSVRQKPHLIGVFRLFALVKPFFEYSSPKSFPQFVENRVGCGIFYEVRPVRVSFAFPWRRRQIMQHALGRTTDGRPYDRCISFFCRGAHCASVPKPPSGRGDAECNEAGGSKRKHHFSFGEVYALSFTRYAGAPSRREPKIENERADDQWSPLRLHAPIFGRGSHCASVLTFCKKRRKNFYCSFLSR